MDKLSVSIVGAGLSGATVARALAEKGYSVTVYDKRATVGGNVYDYVNADNIRIQQYGPHIFHTSDKGVLDFLSQFTEWVPYEHKVLGNIKGKLVPVPFNFTSLHTLLPADEANEIEKTLTEKFGKNQKVPILSLRAEKEKLLHTFADYVYKNVFYTYTHKQWGFKPEQLGEAVTGRVPVYCGYDDRYFTDTYQVQPKDGFTPLVERMLYHKNIKLKLGVDACEFFSVKNGAIYFNDEPYDGILVFTGKIDELLSEKYGRLAYRSLRFKFETHDTPSYQDAAVVNYNTSERYTRISEFSKFCCKPQKKTVICIEYPKPCHKGDIPYYPMPTKPAHKKYEKYKAACDKIPNLYLLGRLAAYKYVNMDMAVRLALDLADKLSEEN